MPKNALQWATPKMVYIFTKQYSKTQKSHYGESTLSPVSHINQFRVGFHASHQYLALSLSPVTSTHQQL